MLKGGGGGGRGLGGGGGESLISPFWSRQNITKSLYFKVAQLIFLSIVADQITLIVKRIYFRVVTADCDYSVFTSANMKVF